MSDHTLYARDYEGIGHVSEWYEVAIGARDTLQGWRKKHANEYSEFLLLAPGENLDRWPVMERETR